MASETGLKSRNVEKRINAVWATLECDTTIGNQPAETKELKIDPVPGEADKDGYFRSTQRTGTVSSGSGHVAQRAMHRAQSPSWQQGQRRGSRVRARWIVHIRHSRRIPSFSQELTVIHNIGDSYSNDWKLDEITYVFGRFNDGAAAQSL
jgi:hypothetical protein